MGDAHRDWIFCSAAYKNERLQLYRPMSPSTDKILPIAFADAAGNKVLVIDARRSLLSPDKVHLLFRQSLYQTCVPPDILTILQPDKVGYVPTSGTPTVRGRDYAVTQSVAYLVVLQAWSTTLLSNFPTLIDTSFGTVMADQNGQKHTSMTLSKVGYLYWAMRRT